MAKEAKNAKESGKPKGGSLAVPVHRTASFVAGRGKQPKFVEACEALMRAARSLENSTTFLLRNFKSAFENGSLKAELHENEKACVKAMDEAVGEFLARKKPELEGKLRKAQEAVEALGTLGKKPRKKAEDAEKVQEAQDALDKAKGSLASLPRRLGDRPGDKGAFGPGLASNISIVDIAYRKLTHLKEDGSRGHALQKALPAAMSTGCREAVQERFKAHGEAVKTWHANPAKFTGRPQMPGYHGQGELASLRIQAAAIHSTLPSIAGKPLFLDEDCSIPLPDAAVDAWNSTDVSELVAKLRTQLSKEGRKLRVGRLASLRFIPEPGGVRIEGVFECEAFVEADSPLGAFISAQAKEAAEKAAKKEAKSGKRKRKDGKPKFAGFEICAHRAAIQDAARGHGKEELARTAGLDLGLVNAATIAFGSGRPAIVISGSKIESEIAALDAKVERAISNATSQRLRDLQSLDSQEREAGRKLALPLWREMKSLSAKVELDPELQKLRSQRKRRQKALAHQLASAIVRELVAEGIQTLCVGKNDFWKQSTGKGSEFNKRLHAIPHAAIIEALLHKCLEASILPVLVDEAWSSKCSFALNEAFPDLPKDFVASTSTAQPPETFLRKENPTQKAPRSAKLAGRRASDPSSKAKHAPKNCFETPGLSKGQGGWGRVHADANGAYNIVRRACPAFQRHAGLSPRFELHWLSPCGLRAFGEKPCLPKAERQAPSVRPGAPSRLTAVLSKGRAPRVGFYAHTP